MYVHNYQSNGRMVSMKQVVGGTCYKCACSNAGFQLQSANALILQSDSPYT